MLVAASASYGYGLWWMTLRPSLYDERASGVLHAVLGALASWGPTAWITFGVVEFAANVGLFVPLGVLAVAWGARRRVAVLSGAGLSATIELTQLMFLPSRVADVRDIVANTAGAALGAALLALIARRRRSRSSAPG